MKGTINERVVDFVNWKGISIREFERRIGASNGYAKNIKGNIGSTRMCGIMAAFPELNTHWLISGEGEMLNEVAPLPGVSIRNGDVSVSNGSMAQGNVMQTLGAGTDMSACLEIIKRMQEQIIALQGQLQESHCRVTDLLMQMSARQN